LNDERNRECIFWQFFCEDKDYAILKVVMNYFKAVASVFPEDWASDNSPLNRTIGYSALMKLMEPLYRRGLAQESPTLETEFFVSQFAKARHLAPFTFQNYSPSGGGESAIYRDLADAILKAD
jgi:hypothetical protein